MSYADGGSFHSLGNRKNLLEKKPHTRTNAYPHGRTKLSAIFCNCLIFSELAITT
nr:MAG TPA: hypothetical protein [Caudoviricetes sp.]